VNLTAVDGVLTMQDDVKDYVDRGLDLAQMSFLDFFKNTYEGESADQTSTGQGQKPNR